MTNIISPSKIFFTVLATTLFCLAIPLCGLGATVTVSVVNFAFVPATTNIAVGDRVIWSWGSGFHSTTSTHTPPLWDSGAQFTPFFYTNTFTTNGTFPYECTVHLFTGSIIVAPATQPPTVAITNPAPGAVFSAPADVTIRAAVNDPNSGGSVTNVQFLAGPTILTNEAAAPFVAVAANLAAGGYTLTAVATDNLGASATNTVTISVVTPVPLALGAPQQVSATAFQFNYAANAGLNYIVQRATTLAPPDWTTIATNTAAGNPEVFTDVQATNNPGFYRVGRLPNP
jgi:hypothetical protein